MLACRLPHAPALPHFLKGRIVIDNQSTDDIRGLFDWRNAAVRPEPAGGAAATDVGNDDLALAPQLLSCNFRDREQFVGTRGGAAG